MLVFVSTNKGKIKSVKGMFKELNIDVDCLNEEIDELEVSDIYEVSKDKCQKAYQKLGIPCFVIDSGFYIDAFNGFPGTLGKRSGITVNPQLTLELMKNIKNRRCAFVDCLTFYDGNIYKQFVDYSYGTIGYEIRGNDYKVNRSQIWYLFIPENRDKTLAEMTEAEYANRSDNPSSAIKDFGIWYKNEYLNAVKLMKKKN